MPTIELHGFAAEEADDVVARARALLADLPYREDIVFDHSRVGGRVINWAGGDQPFLRVHSRSDERLQELRSLLVSVADVETLIIGFFPRAAQ